ncbi:MULTISPECIES: hypothetical protein [unclassified Xanthobacter]|uniref:hypothetical protein n=1 Tax=unclassified Xanthobacter TaxID=2623496 RepID=UPI001EDDE179|nr:MULTISPECIES: hypothetical protein [unclassified Xanthobacter]
MSKPVIAHRPRVAGFAASSHGLQGHGQGHGEGFDLPRSATWLDAEIGTRSAADPDTLARAVRAHKAGDALAQAALTVALMMAIGAVAVVLSVERAAAAGLLVRGVIDHSATLAGVAVIGGLLLVATRATLRHARVRARRR